MTVFAQKWKRICLLSCFSPSAVGVVAVTVHWFGKPVQTLMGCFYLCLVIGMGIGLLAVWTSKQKPVLCIMLSTAVIINSIIQAVVVILILGSISIGRNGLSGIQ